MGFFKRKQNMNCGKCKLNKNTDNPCIPVSGQGEKGILFIVSAPSSNEDDLGSFGHGMEYDALKNRLNQIDIDLDRDCYYMAAISCFPMDNRKIPVELDDKYVDCCRANVYSHIEKLKPKVVIPMGTYPLKSLYSHRHDFVNGITQWRGKHVPDQKLGCWVAPIYDYDWISDHQSDQQAILVYDNDLEQAVAHADIEFKKLPCYKDKIKLLMEYNDIIELLDQLIAIQPEAIAFDYESNARRPYAEGTKLLTMSMYIPELDTAYAFPLQWRKHFTRREVRVLYRKLRMIMTNKETRFIAHNLSMEDSWTSEKMEFYIENWYWDTMIMQHLIDTTPKSKGLKMQCFLRWGVEGYDDYSKKFITDSDDETDGVSFNKLEDAKLPLVLEYNAYDSLFTWHLFQEQVEEFAFEKEGNEQRKFISELYNDSAVAMTRTSQMGMKINVEYFEMQRVLLTAERDELEKKFIKSAEVKQFERQTGEVFKITSAHHLRILFFDIMGYEAKKKTKKGSDSADHEALTNIDHPHAKAILQIRKIDKIIGTYIGQFQRLCVDNFLHPDFLLHVARTSRTSCVNPNIQNISKRDAMAKKVVRSGIIAPVGYHFGEIDYDTLEVKIFATYCKDPALINYLLDAHSDMHRDQAMKIFMFDHEWQITKTIRFEAKNGWVFALFYGSYWKSCARNIWEKIISQKDLILGKKNPTDPDIHLKDHLKKKGIKTQEDFAHHLKRCEDKLWAIFHVTREYQQNAFKSALEKGYVESYYGFRRGGYIERGQIINTPVQGQGCQCLLDSYRILWKQSRREQWKSYFAGQIHDSILPMLHPTEVIHVLDSLYKTMCVDMEAKNEWLIVPMGIEASIAKMGDSWYSLIDFKRENGIWVQAKSNEPIESVLELPTQRVF